MTNFWDYNVWGALNLFATILIVLLLANALKKYVKFLRKSLIPTPVLGGMILLLVAMIYNSITQKAFFDTPFFGNFGYNLLETIAYHTLAIGFIASTLKSTKTKITKKRGEEVLNTGLTTVSTYLLQGILGLMVTIIAAFIVPNLLSGAGVLLPFGYGQGTGQALNYGNIFETDYAFVGGKSFGLTLAAFGFLSASIGGVIHLHTIKKKNPVLFSNIENAQKNQTNLVEESKDGSLSKLTVQIALIAISYLATFAIMFLLGNLIPSMKSIIYGFNFLLGTIMALSLKGILNLLKKKRLIILGYWTNKILITH